MNERIIRKVKHLLALSKSSNEHEAQNAMLKVQELLMKYKLSMEDVANYEEDSFTVEERVTGFSFTKAKWKASLAAVLSENLGCYCYLKTRRTNYITFFGKEDDVAICEITYKYALDAIACGVNKLKKQYKINGFSVKGLESDYAMGFVFGLHKRFEEQREKHQEWGLVLLKDKKVIEEFEKKDIGKTYNAKTTFNGNYGAYFKGEKDGKDFCITDKVSTKEDVTLMIE